MFESSECALLNSFRPSSKLKIYEDLFRSKD